VKGWEGLPESTIARDAWLGLYVMCGDLLSRRASRC